MIRWGARVAAVALVYFAAGRVALLMAIPPGYATAVWPAAGLALVSLLLLGPRAWPGVMLGSFLVNVGTSFDTTSGASILRSLAIALSIGVGAALQALAGSGLVRRYVGYPTSLDSERDIGRFLALGGPVSCLVAASWGVLTLVIAGVVPPQAFGFSWWTWWVGDTIGVIVFAPLALAFTGEPREVWRRRRLLVAAPVALALIAVTLLFIRTSRWEQQRIDGALDLRAQALGQALQRHVAERISDIYAVASFFESGVPATRSTFGAFAQRLLTRHRGLRVLSWIPRVQAADRAAYERAARREGYAAFQITERAADGTLVPAGPRAAHLPVYYLEPYAGNEAALGFDLASDRVQSEALLRAHDKGVLAASAPLRLVQETAGQAGFVVFAPVFAAGRPQASAEQRGQLLVGFASGAFRLDELVDEALRGVDARGLRIQLEDERASGDRVLYRLGATQANEDTRSSGEWSTTLEVAGRLWRLRIVPTAEAAAAGRSWQAWVVLVAGLAFVGGLGAILLLTTGRELLVERHVAERTRDLQQAYADLARAQDEQRTSRALYQGLFEDAPDALLVVDSDGLLRRVSREAERAFGYPVGELVGQPVERLLPEQLRDTHVAHRDAFAAQPQRRSMGAGLDLSARRRDGSELPVDVMLSPLATGEVLAVVRDITERKRVEAELKRSNEELQRFAHVASHDLQEPLRMVTSYTQLLARRYRGWLDAEADEFIGYVTDAASRMQRLVSDLLEYSRVSSEPREPAPVDTGAALQRALDNLRVAIEESGAKVSRDSLPTVTAEGGQLVQLFQNLIGNALKFRGKQAPRVHVSASEQDRSWLFRVSDNGIGIAAQYHTRIFQMFQRLHTRAEYPGTGAGLAICQRIVEHHGGRIWVESTLGEGTTFCFTLPSSGASERRGSE